MNADGGGKEEVGQCCVVAQPSPCHTAWSVLSADWGARYHLIAPLLFSQNLPWKAYRATTEAGAQYWKHYVPLYLFYSNELVE